MRVFSFIVLAVGALLMVGSGVALGLRTAKDGTDASATLASSEDGSNLAASGGLGLEGPSAPNVAVEYVEWERPDLRPAVPSNLDYRPETRNVSRYRFVEGLRPRRVSVYDGGSGSTPRPVVVLFHGAGRNELSMIDMWDDTADAHGILLISIKSNGGSWDPEHDYVPTIQSALDRAGAEVPIDRSRIYLFGHSAGSIYAQLLANRVNAMWRAVATHAGTLPEAWVIPNATGVPIRHYLGRSDGIFPPHDARVTAQALHEAGHRSELVLVANHSHWFYEGGPAFAEDAWAWFEEMSE